MPPLLFTIKERSHKKKLWTSFHSSAQWHWGSFWLDWQQPSSSAVEGANIERRSSSRIKNNNSNEVMRKLHFTLCHWKSFAEKIEAQFLPLPSPGITQFTALTKALLPLLLLFPLHTSREVRGWHKAQKPSFYTSRYGELCVRGIMMETSAADRLSEWKSLPLAIRNKPPPSQAKGESFSPSIRPHTRVRENRRKIKTIVYFYILCLRGDANDDDGWVLSIPRAFQNRSDASKGNRLFKVNGMQGKTFTLRCSWSFFRAEFVLPKKGARVNHGHLRAR